MLLQFRAAQLLVVCGNHFSLRTSKMAVASWSGQLVGLLPQRIPFNLFAASAAFIPSQRLAMPCVFPEHPPRKRRFLIFPSLSMSKSISFEQVPVVVYVLCMIFGVLWCKGTNNPR